MVLRILILKTSELVRCHNSLGRVRWRVRSNYSKSRRSYAGFTELPLREYNRFGCVNPKSCLETSSTTKSSTSTTSEDEIFRKSTATPPGLAVTPPRAIFPWRHELDPLPRLVRGTEESLQQGGAFGPGFTIAFPWFFAYVMETLAGSNLMVPWYKLLGSQWKHELAQSSGWAFSQGVAAVLSNTYDVPFDDIKPEDEDGIRFRQRINESPSQDDGRASSNSQTMEENSNLCPEVRYMLQEKLRLLYESAHESGKGQMEIRLDSRPTSAMLESLIWIPFLTRDVVKDHPNLRHAYNMRAEIVKKAHESGRDLTTFDGMRIGMEIIDRLAETTVQSYADGEVWSHTLVAQVSVQCDEVFCVTDLKTGEVVQGHADFKLRPVTHLVRLENVVETRFPVDGSSSIQSVGSWQITDWDDLLDGNLWLSI